MSKATEKRSVGSAGNGRPTLADENPDTLRLFYERMLLLRRFEERTGEMYTKAKIGGYCHLNLGEEATIVGLMAALTPDDYIFTNYREHGYIIARGVAPGSVMAELFGKEHGVSKGRGGSMHLFDIEFAEKSPDPQFETLFDYMYATPVPNTSGRAEALEIARNVQGGR